MNWDFSGKKGSRNGFLERGNHNSLEKEDLKEVHVERKFLIIKLYEKCGGKNIK